MKRVREVSDVLLAGWADEVAVKPELAQRLVDVMERDNYHIVPMPGAPAPNAKSGGVRIKYQFDNPFGPVVQATEHMPRHVLAFLDLVSPTTRVKLQEHQWADVKWDECPFSEKPSKLIVDDADSWATQTIGTGYWHSAVFNEHDAGEMAYNYYYGHMDRADQGQVRDDTLDMWNGVSVEDLDSAADADNVKETPLAGPSIH